eukprot:675204-Hanusia_phi.AAC.5
MISQQFFNDHPVVAIAAGSTFSLAATTEGSIFQWGNLSWEERIVRQPERVKGVAGAVKSLAVGGRHCLAVMEDGSLFAWGCNEAGQLGDGTRTLRQEAVRLSLPPPITLTSSRFASLPAAFVSWQQESRLRSR